MKSLSQARAWLAIATVLLGIFGLAQSGAAQAVIFVTTTQQGITGSSSCSLQEAIYSAEFATNKAISSTDPDSYYTTGCVPGTGNGDTIVLPSDAVLSFSQFWDGDAHNIYGPTATPVIFTNIIIDGNYSTLQWTGTGNSRLFAIGTVKVPNFGSGTGSLTLRNVYIKGFHVKGGNGGGGGGGGGLGAGGAIYLNDGALTVEDSTFDGNGAVGGAGNGTTSVTEGAAVGGGGGGLSGNGGVGGPSNAGGGGGSRGDGGKSAYQALIPGTEGVGAAAELCFQAGMELFRSAAWAGISAEAMVGALTMMATQQSVRAEAVVGAGERSVLTMVTEAQARSAAVEEEVMATVEMAVSAGVAGAASLVLRPCLAVTVDSGAVAAGSTLRLIL
jgi:hypothetical protein